MRLNSLIVCGVLVLGACGIAAAQEPDAIASPKRDTATSIALPETPAGRVLGKVLDLFGGNDEALKEADFAESFTQQVPMAKLLQLTHQIRAAEGSLSLDSIAEGASERALVANVMGSKKRTPYKLRLTLDEQGKIAGLLIQPGVDARVPPLKSWDDLRERLKSASEKSAFTLREIVETTMNAAPEEDGKPGVPTVVRDLQSRVYHNSEQPLAIGSAFKLWVLGALATAVESGDMAWDQPLKIREEWKSLPSGVMQNEAAGKEFPAREFAMKMISISDNTATDHLINTLGRDKCERIMGRCAFGHAELNTPFLTTRDLFALKLSGSDELPRRYITSGVDTRRALVSSGGEVGKATPQLMLAAAWKAPRYIDSLEWFASGQDLCATLLMLDNLARKPGLEPIREILGKNPGLPIDRKVFTYVGYKGGSEPGVLSLNWLLERQDGKKFILSVTFNDTKKAIDEPLALGLAQRAVEYLGTFDVK